MPHDPRPFLERIKKTKNGCWNYTGYTRPNGYGEVHAYGRRWLAHRLSYTLLVGPIPEKLVIDHLCRNTSCINPAHLEVVMHRVNTFRGFSPFGVNKQKTHCKNGHPLDGKNLSISKANERHCKICMAAFQKEYRKKNPDIMKAIEARRSESRKERYIPAAERDPLNPKNIYR